LFGAASILRLGRPLRLCRCLFGAASILRLGRPLGGQGLGEPFQRVLQSDRIAAKAAILDDGRVSVGEVFERFG
jgi:hypothetical protein